MFLILLDLATELLNIQMVYVFCFTLNCIRLVICRVYLVLLKFVCMDGSVFWEREECLIYFWVLFLIKNVLRVTSDREVGNRIVTE